MRQVGTQHLHRRDALVRHLIVLRIMDYWDHHELDWTPPQAGLEAHIQLDAPITLHRETIRDVLGDLVSVGILGRRRLGINNVSYRLRRRYANILAPGYAPEADDLLIDPIPWVTATGAFLRVGRPNPPYARTIVLPSFPHFFAQHVWLRGWIHSFNLGAFTHPAIALQLVVEATREAPLRALVELWSDDGRADVSALLGETRLLRAVRMAAARPNRVPPSASGGGRWMHDRPEEGLAMLHALCGHDAFQRVTGGPTEIIPRRVLTERLVYDLLDKAASDGVNEKIAKLPPDVRASCREFFLATSSNTERGLDGPEAKRSRQERLAHPSPIRLEPGIRALDDAIRGTMCEYRRAWPRVLHSPAW